jgi:hypothetical protein
MFVPFAFVSQAPTPVAGSLPVTGTLPNLLNTIATYLRGYMSDFRNPSFYAYRLDGTGFHILDGGLDMYDSGNATTPWLRSNLNCANTPAYSAAAYPSASNYTVTSSAVIDTDFHYVSLGYEQYAVTQSLTFLPLTVLGTRATNGISTGWQSGGNSGADGFGTLAAGYIYSGSTVNGFTTYAYYRETYAAGDPSHTDVFMLLGHTNWTSSFGTINAFAQPTANGGNGSYLYTTGSNVANVLAIKTLLSKQSGVQVTAAEIQTVVDNFTLRIRQALNY